MNKYILTLVASTTIAVSSFAAPFLAVGDNAEIFVTGQVGVRADSNIFLSGQDESDLIYNAAPGLELAFGKNSTTQGTVRFAENFTAYSDHTDLNSNLASGAFDARYDDGKTKGALYATYNEFNQNTVDTRGSPIDYLIRSNVMTGGVSGEVSVTDKSTVAGGVDYRWTDYRTTGFIDSESVALPVHYYYQVTPKVDLGLGYRYRATWLQVGNDSYDNFVSLAARGQFTPKLVGKLDVGWTRRAFSGAKDASLLGLDAGLQYAVTPKSSLALNLSNDFDANSQAQQQKNLVIGLTGTTEISSVWSVSAGVNYRSIDYYRDATTHTDDYWVGQAAVSYTVNTYVKITGAVSYADYRTGNSLLAPYNNFTDNVVSLAANIRF